jgi:CRP/FNR family transcriptional regulator
MPEILITSNCNECAFRSILFENLNHEELEYLNSFKVEKKYLKGEFIAAEHDPINEFLYLKKGLVKLFKVDRNEKEHIISIAKPLNFVGFLSVFSQKNYQYSIKAIEDSVVCFIDLNPLKEILVRNGLFAMEVLEKLNKITDDILSNRLNICSKQLRGRIALILLYFSKEVYFRPKFELPLSRKEIAELIEMSTENVIRILSEFRKDQIISIAGSEIEIMNMEALERINKFG